jgi:SulP family sulfate permease
MITNYIQMIRQEFSGYNGSKFTKDLMAGLTVTAVALPLAIAFGVSAGADAASGLITAIVAGIVIGGLSGAYYQISGPTGAMAAILMGISATYGLQGIMVATLIAGGLLLLAGIFKLGVLTSFLPTPVITGFTSGIAITIALGQIDNFFGTHSEGHSAIEKLASYGELGFTPNWTAAIMGLAVIALMLIWPKRLQAVVPASLVAIIIMTAVNMLFKLDIATVGKIPTTLFSDNRLHLSSLNLALMKEMLSPAISIALLGMIESLLCGASAGRMTGKTLDANQELVAQGIGNLVLPFFGGIPATAAIARTSVAIKSGAVTRLTGIIHAFGLLLAMLVLSPVMSNIPLAALAGVLMVTAFRMNEWETIHYFFTKKFKSAIFLFFLTMIATVVFDLSLAIVAGFVAGLLFFIARNSHVEITAEDVDLDRVAMAEHSHKTAEWTVVYVSGPLFFMTAEKLKQTLATLADKHTVIFSMRGVPSIDSTALQVIRDFSEQAENSGQQVLFSGLSGAVDRDFIRSGFADEIGADKFYFSVDKIFTDLLTD